MKQERIITAETEELVSELSSAAIAYGELFDASKNNQANKKADLITTLYKEIRDRGPDAQRLLLRLLEHPNPDVRYWVATYSLQFSEDGVSILRDLGEQPPGWRRHFARDALRSWERDEIIFP